MKRFAHFTVPFCLIIIMAGHAAAQITITTTDVSAQLAQGITSTSSIDTSTKTINIGALGSTSWDFSGLVRAYGSSATFVNPETTASFSYFPTATHASKTGSTYSYLKLGSNLEFLGAASGSPFPLRLTVTPPEVIEQLPMTGGTAWTSTSAESSWATIGGTTFLTVDQIVYNYSVDAYGSLKLPGGNVYEALRLKSVRHTTANGHTAKSILYQFLTKEGATATVSPSDTNQPDNGTISVANMTWNGPVTTSVWETPGNPLPARFALEQNYPNPFNPTTTIRFSVAQSALVRLRIFDVLGRELKTLVSEQFAPGTYSVKWDASPHPSGVYVCLLQAGSFLESRKLVLMR